MNMSKLRRHVDWTGDDWSLPGHEITFVCETFYFQNLFFFFGVFVVDRMLQYNTTNKICIVLVLFRVNQNISYLKF